MLKLLCPRPARRRRRPSNPIADTCRRPRLPAEPTDALPGTEEKIKILEERASRHESIFHPDDRRIKARDCLLACLDSKGNPDVLAAGEETHRGRPRLSGQLSHRKNRKRPSASKYRGVNRHASGRWVARINLPDRPRLPGKPRRVIYLGLFETELQAARAYRRAVAFYRGGQEARRAA